MVLTPATTLVLGSEQTPGSRGSSVPLPGWAWLHLLCKDLCCGVLHMLCLFSLPVWGVCLSHTPLTVAAIFLWSSAPSLPSLLSWNLWGSGSELCLFPKLPRCTLGLTFALFAVCPRFPPVFGLPHPLSSINSVLAQSHCVCVSIPPTSHGLCSGPVAPSSSLFLFQFLGPSLLGNTPEVLEFGALPVPQAEWRPRLPPPCPVEHPADRLSAAVPLRASLWSSCVVLPLLALTWMSAVLAMTDRRSVLFQALFAVFNSAQGFVITAVHCFLRREVASLFLPSPPPMLGSGVSPPCGTG